MLTSTIARSQRVLFVVRLILAVLIAVAITVALVAPAATASATPAAPACSNTITVMNGNDSGAGSLRQAIADVCEAGTIYFDHDMTVRLADHRNRDQPRANHRGPGERCDDQREARPTRTCSSFWVEADNRSQPEPVDHRRR